MRNELNGVLGCVLLLGAGTAHAREAKYLSLENGTTYALSAGDGALRARITVRAEEKADLARIDVAVADVVAGGTHDPDLLACVTPKKEFGGPGTPAIVLMVKCSNRRPDDYDVTLGVRPVVAKGRAAGAAVQKLTLKLTRPVPVVRSIEAQTVERTVGWPGAGSPAPPRLTIVETSNRTLPVTFTATQVDSATVNGRPVPGRLEFTSATTDKDTGHAALGLSTDESFPLGKAKALVEIRSNELAAPIYVAYEVTTRLHGAYVLGALVLGLCLGFLTRTVLKSVVERGAAKVAALDLLDKMEAARARWNDAAFRAAVGDLTTTLAQALRKADTAALKAAAMAADTAFAALSVELNQRVATVMGSIETTAALAGTPEHFPRAIAAALETAALALRTARTQVTSGDVDAGRKALQDALEAMGREVETGAADWLSSLVGALDGLGALPPLPPALQRVLTAAREAIATQVTSFPAPSRAPNVAAILDAVHAIRFLAQHDVAQKVLRPLASAGAETARILRDADGSAHVEETAAALDAAVGADTDTTLATPAAAAADLLGALRHFITAAAAAAAVNVEQELGAGRYVDAAHAVAGTPQQAAAAAAALGAPAFVPQASTVPPLRLPAPAGPPPIFRTGEPLDVARARTLREIAAAHAVQFAIASAGIAAIGMLALLPAFDGTWYGVLGAFFWGYAGDISVDALTEAAKRAK